MLTGKDDHMARVVVVPEPIDYPDSDGLPMAENESQFWPILYVGSALDRFYQDRDDVYVVGNLLLYYQQGDGSKSVSPDLMVVFGASNHVRSSYRLWEEPKSPDFVLEIASESTYRTDRGEKRDTYADMGVLEYWQYDPVGSYLDPPLLGFRLVEGRYVPIPAVTQEGGLLALRSEVLGLELHLSPGAPVREALHFYNPVRGEYLRTYREADQAREEAERGREEEVYARREAEARLEQIEDRLREEQAARQALEAELRDLRQREG
jgi:Uma2 family endonuclease